METIPRKTRESNLGVVSKDEIGGAEAISPFILVSQPHLCKQMGRKIFTRKTNFVLKKITVNRQILLKKEQRKSKF